MRLFGSKLHALMEGIRTSPRSVLKALALASVLAAAAVPFAFACDTGTQSTQAETQADKVAGEGKQPENRAPKSERCKRSEKGNAKSCPGDGGERLPQDKRSPLDNVPPLAPLVA